MTSIWRTPRFAIIEIDEDDDLYVPERVRNVLMLADEGLSFEEIGEFLDIDPEQVRAWCENAWSEEAAETPLH